MAGIFGPRTKFWMTAFLPRQVWKVRFYHFGGGFGLRVAEFADGVIRLVVIFSPSKSASTPLHPTRRWILKLFLQIAVVDLGLCNGGFQYVVKTRIARLLGGVWRHDPPPPPPPRKILDF